MITLNNITSYELSFPRLTIRELLEKLLQDKEVFTLANYNPTNYPKEKDRTLTITVGIHDLTQPNRRLLAITIIPKDKLHLPKPEINPHVFSLYLNLEDEDPKRISEYVTLQLSRHTDMEIST
jgi:hypothetical protein